ncbi:hypothetical protein ACFGQ5_003361 [Salmonella enterica]
MEKATRTIPLQCDRYSAGTPDVPAVHSESGGETFNSQYQRNSPITPEQIEIRELKKKLQHFDCSGELVMEYPDIRGDISVRYVFNGSNGVAILRGKITDNNGENLAVNQNVWFTFTRKDDDYFMESGNVASSSGGTNIHPLLARTLPDFFLKPKEPFYFSILRLNSSTWQFYTSRSPSVFCQR